jgi:hypothetical protein
MGSAPLPAFSYSAESCYGPAAMIHGSFRPCRRAPGGCPTRGALEKSPWPAQTLAPFAAGLPAASAERPILKRAPVSRARRVYFIIERCLPIDPGTIGSAERVNEAASTSWNRSLGKALLAGRTPESIGGAIDSFAAITNKPQSC